MADEFRRRARKMVDLRRGDCCEVMKTLADNSVDSVVTDPPYGIRFMGTAWDGADIERRAQQRRNSPNQYAGAGPNGGHNSIAAEAGKYNRAPKAMAAFQEFSRAWAVEALRVLKPGGHVLSFSSPRTYHRMVAGLEDAGFEIRDQLMWMFGSGFPKSHDVSKAIDKAAGAEREIVSERAAYGIGANSNTFNGHSEGATAKVTVPATDEPRLWQGWGTALKPAHEPICLARKPLESTVAANVLRYGTGALNIDASRVGDSGGTAGKNYDKTGLFGMGGKADIAQLGVGRWPANVMHDGSQEVRHAFPRVANGSSKGGRVRQMDGSSSIYKHGRKSGGVLPEYGDGGTASRFFYSAKASKADRGGDGNIHATVKPVALMRYLCKLITPPGGVVLDPFMGSGSTIVAARLDGFRSIGIDLSEEYLVIVRGRLDGTLNMKDDEDDTSTVGGFF